MKRRSPSPLWLAALLLSLAACGADSPQVIRIALSPRDFDPSKAAEAAIAALHEPVGICVDVVGSNDCADFDSVPAAEEATGYHSTEVLSKTSEALFKLPRGRACFVAEVYDTFGASLAVGCADVDIDLDEHRVEIIVDEP